jgi:hypothetical protein
MADSLFGDLMDAASVQQWLSKAVGASSDISLCSAYIRSEALQHLLTSAPAALCGRVLVRWQIGDLLAGASDLRTFEICRARGLKLFMRLDFHGKVYSVPPFGVIVGSSNATLSGLALKPGSNTEASTLVQCKPSNMLLVDQFFTSATEITEDIVAAMQHVLGEVQGKSADVVEWPDAVLDLLSPAVDIRRLLVSQCLWSTAEGFESGTAGWQFEHDLSVLGVGSDDKPQRVRAALRKCAIYKWLVSTLEREPANQLYFGRLSSLLQDSLLDDPSPTRRDVKELLQCLLSWIQKFPTDELMVDRPNYSQRVTLAPVSRP